LLAVTGAKRFGSNRVVRSVHRVVAANADHPFWALFMRRSFIKHHCFAMAQRRSLELNPCRVNFIKI